MVANEGESSRGRPGHRGAWEGQWNRRHPDPGGGKGSRCGLTLLGVTNFYSRPLASGPSFSLPIPVSRDLPVGRLYIAEDKPRQGLSGYVESTGQARVFWEVHCSVVFSPAEVLADRALPSSWGEGLGLTHLGSLWFIVCPCKPQAGLFR